MENFTKLEQTFIATKKLEIIALIKIISVKNKYNATYIIEYQTIYIYNYYYFNPFAITKI